MRGRLSPVSELTAADRTRMLELLSTHFQGVTPAGFQRDLDEKNWVIRLEDEAGVLKGFSTILMYESDFAGEPISVVFSGDTIMDPSGWSSSIMARAWISAVNQLRARFPRGRLYWLLISSGYRTYRFLPTFFKEFFPRHDAATPADARALLDHLARKRYGDRYDQASGVVKLSEPQVLSEELSGIPAERKADAHIAFFEKVNPGHVQGDELACLCEIAEGNLTAAGRRMWFAREKLGS